MYNITQRRSRLDIIVDILGITRQAVGKTRIIYGANLNFNMANKYLNLLIKKGYLEKKEVSATKYITTEKGKNFLVKAKEFNESFDGL